MRYSEAEALLQQLAVGQSGQGVMEGEVSGSLLQLGVRCRQLSLGGFALFDVFGDPDGEVAPSGLHSMSAELTCSRCVYQLMGVAAGRGCVAGEKRAVSQASADLTSSACGSVAVTPRRDVLLLFTAQIGAHVAR